MKTSEQIDKIAEALAKAQGEMTNPETNKTVTVPGKYSFNYVDLPKLYDCTRPILTANGLSHSSGVVVTDHHTLLSMRLMHSSGQWLESDYPLPRDAGDKELAASITYGKRYLFSSLTGIVGDDDLDGAPDTPQTTVVSKPKAATAAKTPIKPVMAASGLGHVKNIEQGARDQVNKALMDLYKPFLERFPGTDFAELLTRKYGASETRLLTIEQLRNLVDYLEDQILGALPESK